ncbi:MAG: outer membrane protein assembly factor BamD [Acidobacteriota bacterium]|nr:outer membrane protein assembly factor BamD [Acidobacteriota bacterium]
MKSLIRYVTIAMLAGAAAGCAANKLKVPQGSTQPDRYLYEQGEASLKAHHWTDAHELFQKIVDNYPQSQYVPQARLGLGDAYLGQKTPESLVLALNQYREYLTYYPTSDQAPYAQYQLAMTHFNQMRGPERDQTQTRDAIQEFETFLQRYPNSTLVADAEKRLREAKDRLDEHDYEVGLFYFHINWYPGAIDRFQSILKSDPQYSGRDAVLFYLGESLVKLKRPAEALPYYVQLVKQFERSQYLQDAQKRIAELKGSQKAQETKQKTATAGPTGGH